MKISIVTIVRNDAGNIAGTIESVLAQDHPDVEYIIVDGASTDGTLAVIDRYRDRLARVISEPDKGIYDAMNKGICCATGEVIGMINSGDRYFPGALSCVAASFGKDPGRRIFWGDVEYEFLGRVKGFREKNRYIGAFAPHPSMFVPRSVYEEIGLYDDSFRLLGDYDFMYRAVNVKGIEPLYVPELIAFYKEGGVSDQRIARCLADELRVKIKYGQPRFQAYFLYILKLMKNLHRILFAKI